MRVLVRYLFASLYHAMTVAVECDWSEPRYLNQNGTDIWGTRNRYLDYGQYFQTQEEVDLMTEGCTTIINANMAIAENYMGSFIVKGITNLTGTITSGRYIPSAPDLTSIEMPDLVYFNGDDSYLDVYDADTLTNISFPKLQFLCSAKVEETPNAYLDFPSLLNATEIVILGNFSSINFPVLAEVKVLTICKSVECYPYDGRPRPRFAVNLPSLVNVTLTLQIHGDILNLSLPLLSKIGSNTLQWYSKGLQIDNSGLPLDISFPMLSNVTYKLGLTGNVGSVSLPLLAQASNDIVIYTEVEQDLILPSLTVADELEVSGNLTGLSLPTLQSITSVYISHNGSTFYCKDEIEMARNHTKPFYCSARWKEVVEVKETKRVHLPEGAIVGISLAAASVTILALLCFRNWWNDRKAAEAKKKEELAAIELQERYDAADCDSTAGTEVGSIHSDATVVQEVRGPDREVGIPDGNVPRGTT